eukprot:TRINITY_DN5485_c0_g1_i3.p1 TRINITY_DN5485_c0_g1~~TRINITY_DN5485_c0_g1_i3.p1  ORF type:complete len:357 (-),score=75.04 TRINITY_DN5485_c0_g1_i3:648-1718(-)
MPPSLAQQEKKLKGWNTHCLLKLGMVQEDEHWPDRTVEQDHWSSGIGSPKEIVGGFNLSVPKLSSVCHVPSSLKNWKAHDTSLCSTCHAKIHDSSGSHSDVTASRSEKEWLCDVCEHAPAVVTCKGDGASLCVSCENDIPSADRLAGRHGRLTFVNGFSLKPTLSNNNNLEYNNFLNDNGDNLDVQVNAGEETNNLPHSQNHEGDLRRKECYPEENTAPWMIPDTNKVNLSSGNWMSVDDRSVKDKLKLKAYLQSIDFLQDAGSYVDLAYLDASSTATTPILNSAATANADVGTDSMVPVQSPDVYDHPSSKVSHESGASLDMAAYKSMLGYRVGSLNHCVSTFIHSSCTSVFVLF